MVPRATTCLLLSVIVCGLPLSGCRRDQQNNVRVMGSTSIQPFAEELGLAFEKKNPGKKVDVQGGGSTAGLEAVTNGLADIGTCSRSLTQEEAGKFNEIVIARDGLAVVVHPDNPVNELSTEQVNGLFSGRIKSWKEVGGEEAPVRLVTREEGSGTREAFQHLIMGKETISRDALVQESTGAVKQLIQGDKQAVGYISLGLVGTEVKAVKVDGEIASKNNVLSGKYKLVRPLLFITKGAPNQQAQAFIDYVLSDEAQKRLESEGLTRAK